MPDDVLSTARAVSIHNFLHLAPLIILYYDHLITFSDEVTYLWTRPKTLSTWLFLLNRYLAFFGNIPVLIMDFMPLSQSSCIHYSTYRQLLIIANVLLVGGLLTVRIYALYELNNRLLSCLGVIAAILIAIGCWAMFGQHQDAQELPGCHTAMSPATALRLVAAWEALFAYDTLLFVLMIRKTYKARRPSPNKRQHTKISLLWLVVRDGAVYFAVMGLANLSNIFTFYIAKPLLKGVLSTLASSVSVTMLSRLMLNLHKWADNGILLTTTRTHLDALTLEEATEYSENTTIHPEP